MRYFYQFAVLLLLDTVLVCYVASLPSPVVQKLLVGASEICMCDLKNKSLFHNTGLTAKAPISWPKVHKTGSIFFGFLLNVLASLCAGV